MKRGILCIILLTTVHAWCSQASFEKRFGTKDGLIQYSVGTIVQDTTGFMWFGTEAGISRFDGVQFLNFASMNGFTNEAVIGLFVFGNDVYALSAKGDLYKHTDNQMQLVPFGERILYAFGVENDALWLITPDVTHDLFSGKSYPQPFNQTELTERRPAVFTWNNRTLIAVGSNLYECDVAAGFRKVHGFDERVVALSAVDGQTLAVITSESIILVNELYDVQELIPVRMNSDLTCAVNCGGVLYVGTSGGEVFRLNGKRELSLFAESDSSNAVMSIYCDYEQSIWVGLDSGGLLLYPKAKFRSWTADEGIGSGDVFFVVPDRERGGVWAGTRNGGIAYIDPEFRVSSFTESNGLSSNKIRSMMQLPDGRILVGTDVGIDCISMKMEIRPVTGTRGRSFRIMDVFEGYGVLAGTYDGGVFQLNVNRLRAQQLFQLSAETQVRDIQVSGSSILLGTGQGMYQWEDGRIRELENFRLERINRILKIDTEHFIVATTTMGIWEYQGGQWKQIGRDITGERSVLNVIPSPDGSYWFGTDKGVIVLSSRGEWSVIDSSQGLTSEIVYLIGFDVLGNTWIGGNAGLNLFRDGEFEGHFDYQDGLADNELNGFGFANDNAGLAWFCTMRGISCINPTEIEKNTAVPRIAITGVEINGTRQEMVFGVQSGVTTPLVLENDQNSLKFKFSALTYVNPSRVRYTCFLEGYDTNWSYPQSERTAPYPKLPPGEYVFHVRCENGDEVWSETLSFPFSIKFAIYQKTWFHLLLAAIGVLLMFGLFDFRTRRMQKRNRELEDLIHQRTKELAEANRELQVLSSLDPLTGLYNRRFFKEKIKEDVAFSIRQHIRRRNRREVRDTLGFFMLDIDHFKELNDTEGHDAGDIVLKEVARRLKETIRASDVISRWGGEEFLLLSKENNAHDAVVLAERLRRSIADMPFQVNGKSVTKTVSMGFCIFPPCPAVPDLFTWEETVQIADEALYASKRAGRDRWTGVRVLRESLTVNEMEVILKNLEQAEADGLIEIIRGGKADAG